jgi:RNA 2',3'-cyclic 3'-phosphodiesterase
VSRFVGLEVADDARRALAARLAPLADRPVAWTRPDGWHVTLAYCGDLPDSDLPDLGRAVAAAIAGDYAAARGDVGAAARAGGDLVGDAVPPAAVGGVELTLGGVRHFDQGALVIEVADRPAGWVAAFGLQIQAAIADAGLPVARREMRPHLTVARARGDRTLARRTSRAIRRAIAGAQIGWRVDAVALFRSEPGEGPAHYVVEARVPLG